jgi:hypothetical protein
MDWLFVMRQIDMSTTGWWEQEADFWVQIVSSTPEVSCCIDLVLT